MPGFEHPLSKEMLPNIKSEPPLTDTALNHSQASCCWIPGRRAQLLSPHVPSSGSCTEGRGHLSGSSLQTRPALSAQPSSQDNAASPSQLACPPLGTSEDLHVLLQQCSGEAPPMLNAAGQSPLCPAGSAMVGAPQSAVCPLGARAQCWFLLTLLPPAPRSLPAGLLPSHSSPRLDLCLALFSPVNQHILSYIS